MNYTKLALEFPGRKPSQIRDRFDKQVDPSIRHPWQYPWSDDELRVAQSLLGKKWKWIEVQEENRRTFDAFRNLVNTMERKKKKEEEEKKKKKKKKKKKTYTGSVIY